MAWRSHGDSNEELVENLWRNGLITDERVKAAFLKVDRAHYAPSSPYRDRPQPIGHGATISAPHMHATAIEKLLRYLVPEPEPESEPSSPSTRNRPRRVLDIGSGSGYLTHVMAELAGEGATVVGVEHIAYLRDLGEANMAKSERGREMLTSGRVRFRVGDGRRGWVEPSRDDEAAAADEDDDAGWDAIHVGASAVEMHSQLVGQLRAPGRMFIPVDDDGPGSELGGQHVWAVDKDGMGVVTKRRLFAVKYVPLTAPPKGPEE